MQNYWEIEQFDGTRTSIPPDAVDKVKTWLANGQAIILRTAVIPANQIKSFRETSRPYSPVPLLEAAAQTFGEAQYNPDGSVISRWVKKAVTQREYSSYYSKSPGYKHLAEDSGHVWVAYFQPVHEINTSFVQYCTEDETERLNNTK